MGMHTIADAANDLPFAGNAAAAATAGWDTEQWQLYNQVRTLLGARLLARIGHGGRLGMGLYSLVGALLASRLVRRLRALPADATFPQHLAGPDGTRIGLGGLIPSGASAWTWGHWMVLGDEAATNPVRYPLTVVHEYVHVLQYRADGLAFIPRYLRGGLRRWDSNPYEVQACTVEELYRQHPWLPAPWDLSLVTPLS